jgi:hypothetical protein
MMSHPSLFGLLFGIGFAAFFYFVERAVKCGVKDALRECGLESMLKRAVNEALKEAK